MEVNTSGIGRFRIRITTTIDIEPIDAALSGRAEPAQQIQLGAGGLELFTAGAPAAVMGDTLATELAIRAAVQAAGSDGPGDVGNRVQRFLADTGDSHLQAAVMGIRLDSWIPGADENATKEFVSNFSDALKTSVGEKGFDKSKVDTAGCTGETRISNIVVKLSPLGPA